MLRDKLRADAKNMRKQLKEHKVKWSVFKSSPNANEHYKKMILFTTLNK